MKNSLNNEGINHVIKDLSFFIEEKENEQASWVKLWHYWKLENEDFEKVLIDVLDNFKNCSYETPEHLLHVIALLIYFQKNELSTFSLEDIEEQIKKCIKKYETISIWKGKLFENSFWNNTTGLGYMNEEDSDFQRLYNLLKEENERIYEENLIVEEKKKLDILVEAIDNWDEEFIKELLLKEYESKPIFQELSAKSLTKKMKKMNNNYIKELGYILNARYSENKSLNGKKYYCYLTDELAFWKEMKKEFEVLNKSEGVKKHLLQEFENYRIDKIIEKLENCNKGN